MCCSGFSYLCCGLEAGPDDIFSWQLAIFDSWLRLLSFWDRELWFNRRMVYNQSRGGSGLSSLFSKSKRATFKADTWWQPILHCTVCYGCEAPVKAVTQWTGKKDFGSHVTTSELWAVAWMSLRENYVPQTSLITYLKAIWCSSSRFWQVLSIVYIECLQAWSRFWNPIRSSLRSWHGTLIMSIAQWKDLYHAEAERWQKPLFAGMGTMCSIWQAFLHYIESCHWRRICRKSNFIYTISSVYGCRLCPCVSSLTCRAFVPVSLDIWIIKQ